MARVLILRVGADAEECLLNEEIPSCCQHVRGAVVNKVQHSAGAREDKYFSKISATEMHVFLTKRSSYTTNGRDFFFVTCIN